MPHPGHFEFPLPLFSVPGPVDLVDDDVALGEGGRGRGRWVGRAHQRLSARHVHRARAALDGRDLQAESEGGRRQHDWRILVNIRYVGWSKRWPQDGFNLA